MFRHGAIRPLVPVFLFAGMMGSGAMGRDSADLRQYEVRGIVREPLSDNGKLMVEHEDVPGLMPAMTMPFTVRDGAEARDLKPGDGVVFTLSIGEGQASISKIRKTDSASIKLPTPFPRREGAGAPARRVKEGDLWPDFTLTDQNGEPLVPADLAGHYTLLNFVFTRCAVPDFCPLMTRNFSEIASALAADGVGDKVRLLSVSFDPADTPDVLRQYAEANKAGWTFATGQPDEIEKLTHAFAVRVEQEGGTYNHGLCTALIGPDGRILQLWRGNGWKPPEVLDALRAALHTPQLSSLSDQPNQKTP